MFARIVDAGGGLDAFLAEHAVLLTSDHAQTAVEHGLPLADELAEDWAVLQPNADRPEDAEIAVSPTSRAAAVYILDTGRRHASTHERARLRLRELAGVDLVTWLADEDGLPLSCARGGSGGHGAASEAVVERNGHEFRFRPGGRCAIVRGGGWARQRRARGARRRRDARPVRVARSIPMRYPGYGPRSPRPTPATS